MEISTVAKEIPTSFLVKQVCNNLEICVKKSHIICH